MTNFATQLIALVTQIADAAECEAWDCHQLPAGQHHEHCLTAAPAADRPTAYSDGKGSARVFCVACPRPADVTVPLTIDAVEDWDLCPSCGHHVVDVARVAEYNATKETTR